LSSLYKFNPGLTHPQVNKKKGSALDLPSLYRKIFPIKILLKQILKDVNMIKLLIIFRQNKNALNPCLFHGRYGNQTILAFPHKKDFSWNKIKSPRYNTI